MSDAVDRGITVTEIAAMDQPINACPETTAAFVGRALRGPLNTPILVQNFAEFRRRFGDVWGRSSLGPAARQFFDHGGKRLYVVRVANNARGSMLVSGLARVEHPYPTHRPERTLATGSAWDTTYVSATQPGTDGVELSNYDLVGSRSDRTGLFALEQVERFDLLYLPPPGKGKDTGPTAILAAELYCRDRGAMLVVDPPAAWTDVDEAVDGVRQLGFASPNMVGYFPRIRERDDDVARPAGGALAGLLCKQDRSYGPWHDLDQPDLGLQRRLRPVAELDDEDERLLRRAGLNSIIRGAAGRAQFTGSITMGRGSEADRKFIRLPVRRFCLQVINTISKATRWAVFEPEDSRLANRIRGQVLTYFDVLNDLGAFENEQYVVQCDAGVSQRNDQKEHGITLLLLFHPAGCDEPVSMTLHQTPSGCRVGSTAFGLTFHA